MEVKVNQLALFKDLKKLQEENDATLAQKVNAKTLDAFITYLHHWVEIRSMYEMKMRIEKWQTDEDFEARMLAIMTLVKDLDKMLE